METELIQEAIENFQKETPIRIELKSTSPLDGTLRLKWEGNDIELVAWVRNEIRIPFLPQIAERFKEQENLILVAHKIYPKVKEVLRSEQIPYLETAGNIFLNKEGIYLWLDQAKVTGNRDKASISGAFTKSGLKIIYQFLTVPEILNEPYRTIAAKAKVALGTIPPVIESLRAAGFLLRKDKKHFLLDRKKELLEKWIDLYSMKLKPSIRMGEFAPKNGDFKLAKLDPQDSVWGGEVAGEFFTNYLRPERGSIYTRLAKAELIRKYNLIPQKNGSIEVFEMFWEGFSEEEPRENEKLPFASPILTYADLVLTGDKRCLDTAKMIYNEHIEPKL